MFKHVLVATDGTANADKAVSMALSLGSLRVSALLVMPDYGALQLAGATFLSDERPADLRERLRAQGHRLLSEALSRQDACVAEIRHLVAISDWPYQEITETAQREHCDLIVMAPRGHSPLTAALLGSQTARVLGLSSVPVLVVP